MCINIIDDVDCSHKAQTLQLTTAARKVEFLKIHPHPLGSSRFQILPVNGGVFDLKLMLDMGVTDYTWPIF